jgi:hypothetical protein
VGFENASLQQGGTYWVALPFEHSSDHPETSCAGSPFAAVGLIAATILEAVRTWSRSEILLPVKKTANTDFHHSAGKDGGWGKVHHRDVENRVTADLTAKPADSGGSWCPDLPPRVPF